MQTSSLFFLDGEVGSSTLTELRKDAEIEIVEGMNTTIYGIKDTIDRIAESNYETLRSYVQYNGEMPLYKPGDLFIQALFIRLEKVLSICKTTGQDFETVNIALEQEESESIEAQRADCDYILPPDVTAAMNVVAIDLEKQIENSGTEFTGLYDLIGTLYNEKIAYGPLIESYLPRTTSKTVLGNIIDDVKNVVTGIIDDIKQPIEDAGANAFKEILKRNLPLIIGIAFAIAIIIFIAIYAGRKAKVSNS